VKPSNAIRLSVQPITLQVANAYIELMHRHHGASPPGLPYFSIAAVDDDAQIRGVATAAIPNAANRLKDGLRTMEVVRVATDGTPNACSILYAGSAKAARALGFSRIITYILGDETGISIRAAGWTEDPGEYGNLSWANRPGRTGNNYGVKGRWSLDINGTERPPLRLPPEIEALKQEAEPQLSLETNAANIAGARAQGSVAWSGDTA